jgi:hypothetical protein
MLSFACSELLSLFFSPDGSRTGGFPAEQAVRILMHEYRGASPFARWHSKELLAAERSSLLIGTTPRLRC